MKNILVISASPKGRKGNSASIARYAHKQLGVDYMHCSIAYLESEKRNMDSILRQIDTADVLLLSLPIYQNSVPGLVMELFEAVYQGKSGFRDKKRGLFVIANSGFAEKQVGVGAIKTCELFARNCEMTFMGGCTVSPGTLIDGKSLEDTGSTYRRLMQMIGDIRTCIQDDQPLPAMASRLMEKLFMRPLIYRIAGRAMQNATIKKLGKEEYYAKPLTASYGSAN